MKIVVTTSVEEPVPPLKYGGTERIIYLLCQEYVRMGHETFLLASGDSHSAAKLIPVVPRAIRLIDGIPTDMSTREFWKYVTVAKEIEEINKIKPDIIHNHMSWRMITFENTISYPMISTVHGPIAGREKEGFLLHKNHPYISISNNQRKSLPDLNWVGTVYNGIEIDTYPFNESTKDRDYFLFLGRTSPEKGLAEIVQTIKQTKFKLKIAAKIDQVDRDYYSQRVEPFVDGKQIEYVGEVGHEDKVKLLSHAKGLLLWLNWEEPFGLVVPEANACGTPVIVNKRGAMTELIISGHNGFLVDSLEEMKVKLNEVKKLRQANCRQIVESKFTSRIMAEKYITHMQQTIESR